MTFETFLFLRRGFNGQSFLFCLFNGTITTKHFIFLYLKLPSTSSNLNKMYYSHFFGQSITVNKIIFSTSSVSDDLSMDKNFVSK